MKFKFLAVIGLAAAFGAVGCKSAANTNVAVMNTNTMTTTTTPMAAMTPAAMADAAAKTAVEAALKAKGITGVTVEATTTEVTLRGTVADKAKMSEAFMVATETGKRKVVNQLTAAK